MHLYVFTFGNARLSQPAGQRKIRPHPNPPHNGREQQRVSRLFCSAFSMGKLSLYQGDEPLAAEGVKFSSCAPLGLAPGNIFLDRRTKLRLSECVEVYLHTKRARAGSTKLKEHKAKKDGMGTVNKVNGPAVIDGWSHGSACDNVEH